MCGLHFSGVCGGCQQSDNKLGLGSFAVLFDFLAFNAEELPSGPVWAGGGGGREIKKHVTTASAYNSGVTQ